MSIHVAETMIQAKAVGGCKFAGDQSVIVDGDLTSLSAAKTASNVSTAKRHVSERVFGKRVNASLDQIGNFDSTYLTGSSVAKASMLALSKAKGTMSAF